MKAIVYRSYGPPDVLEYEDVETPTPGDDQVLIRVRAAAANPLDVHLTRGTPFFIQMMAGFGKPKDVRVGRDVAGTVEAIGRNVAELKPGDEVFGTCQGAFAEYACASESSLVLKPENVTFEQAAAVPIAGMTALQALRDKGRVQPGQKVLVNGAAGGVGTFAVQIAKSFGADVTGVSSTGNLEMLGSIGADRVVDYTREDFTAGGHRYDVIVDCHSTHSPSALRRALQPKGIFVGVGGPVGSTIGLFAGLAKQLLMAPFVSQKFVTLMTRPSKADLAVLQDLVAAGTVTPVVDRRYALSEAREAIRYLAAGHARGKVVITVGRDDVAPA